MNVKHGAIYDKLSHVYAAIIVMQAKVFDSVKSLFIKINAGYTAAMASMGAKDVFVFIIGLFNPLPLI